MGSPSCEVVLLSQSQTHTIKSNPSVLHIQILLVDDDPTCLSIVARLLKQSSPSEDEMMKLTVTATTSPYEALRALREESNFDIVVMNLHMHEVNGTEFQKQVVRELKVPTIVMSADDDERLMLKTLEGGATFYLLKPVNKEDLKNVWQYAIATKRAKSTIVKEGSSYLNIEKIDYHDTKSTSSVNDDIDHNSGQESIVSKVERKRRRNNKRGKEDGSRDNEDGSGELCSRPKKKSKVVWTSALHTRFLMAINHIGFDKAIPKRILQFMGVPGITRENIASHLQKYRLFLKKMKETGETFSSTLSEKNMRSNFASGSSSVYRGIKLEDLELLKQRTLNRSFKSAYPSSNFIHLRRHNQQLSYAYRFQESSSSQAHLSHSSGIRGSLTNSSQGLGTVMDVLQNRQNQNQMHVNLPKFGGTSSYYNMGTTSQGGAYGYSRIPGNTSIDTQAPTMMNSLSPNQNLNFSNHTNMELNGASCEAFGASKPSFNGANLELKSWVANGYTNVAPILSMSNGPSSYSSTAQLPSFSTNPFPSPPSNNDNQENHMGLSPLNFLENSNGEIMNDTFDDVMNMMDNTSTNLTSDAPPFGENMFNCQLFDDIDMSQISVQSNNDTLPSNTYQQEDGVTKLTFSSDSTHSDAIEMNNLVTQLPDSNFGNELSHHHVEQTTNLEVPLDASSQVQGVDGHANPANFDGKNNVQSEFNLVTEKPQLESEEETAYQLNPSNSFLAEIESILENKDWADQFIECLHEDEDWTSF